MKTTLSPDDAHKELYHNEDITLLDVRLPDDYEATHIPGALSACVLEVGFLDAVASRITSGTPVFIYGADSESAEAGMAFEKLSRAGYAHLRTIEGGLDAWQAAGLPLDQGAPLPERVPGLEGEHALDPDASQLMWEGRNLMSRHYGTLPVSSGTLSFADNGLTGGDVTLDMCRMQCDDLAGTDMHNVLIRHLESDDFFDTERFPEARITITSVQHHPGQGTQNLNITGELTLKDTTQTVTLSASGGLTPEGQFALQGQTSIDRTDWGVIYGSAKFFNRVGMHLVNDRLEIGIKLVTQAP